MLAITVSQLNRYLKAIFSEDKNLSDIYIRGEISNFTNHYRSGHFYFSLKDEKSSVRAVMFSSEASELKFMPENGMTVLVQASVRVYERDGVYQLYIRDMQPDGAGAMAVAFEQLKRKLEAEGLFDASRKKTLPGIPGTIGVITSETGAVFRDICNVLSRRWPLARVLLCPAQVQGDGAVKTLIKALSMLDGKCDIIIIGRGGGSAEDLWCFNSEELARALARTRTPVISAVGHETDFTICDFVADERAPTPSAAAEIAVPPVDEYLRKLDRIYIWLKKEADGLISSLSEDLDRLMSNEALSSPANFMQKKKEKLDFFTRLLYNNKCVIFEDLQSELSHMSAMLDSLSPLRVLERGYSAVYSGGNAVKSAAMLRNGDELDIKMRDGDVKAVVSGTGVNHD